MIISRQSKFLIFFMAFILVSCSKNDDEKIELNLVIDNSKVISEMSSGKSISVIYAKHEELINFVKNACTRRENIPLLRNYLGVNFNMKDSANLTFNMKKIYENRNSEKQIKNSTINFNIVDNSNEKKFTCHMEN